MTPGTLYLIAPHIPLSARLAAYQGQLGRFVRYGNTGGLLTLVLEFDNGLPEAAFTPSEVARVEAVGEESQDAL